jgi:hypothetical protein
MFSLYVEVIIAVIIIAAIVATPVSIYAQQQMNFIANLTGKDMTPPVNTSAMGTAKFHVNTEACVIK